MTLSDEEKRALDEEGYVVMSVVIEPAWLERLRSGFEAAVGPENSGTRHADHLEEKDAAFGPVLTHPRVLAAVAHILQRAFKVSQLGARDPLPGFGQQGLHIDWYPRAKSSDPFGAVTAIWLLDDFVGNNGATRLIAGSHRWLTVLPKAMQQPESRHPQQTIITASAGSVLVFNGHLWHSGTRNQSKLVRRVLQCTFIAMA